MSSIYFDSFCIWNAAKCYKFKTLWVYMLNVQLFGIVNIARVWTVMPVKCVTVVNHYRIQCLFVLMCHSSYSRLSRLSTVRQLYTRLSLVGPTKVTACKSFVCNQKFSIVENNELLFDFVICFYFLSLCFNAVCISEVSCPLRTIV